MKVTLKNTIAALIVIMCGSQGLAQIDVASTVKALRISNTITGGFMPTSDPIFQQMVARVAANDLAGAAKLAAESKYFTSYLARRLALQMQNNGLDAGPVNDSDATAFLIAKFSGTSTIRPSISTIFSENATYVLNINNAQVKAAALTEAQKAALDWSASLVRVDGQQTRTINAQNQVSAAPAALPVKHVGGYFTLSDRANDTSFAQFAATAGTNLRFVESIWNIATGLQLTDTQSANVPPQYVPRFVPEYDPNFFKGQGQAACISCHGGGLASIPHGYATVADTFDFRPAEGLVYNPAPAVNQRKSLGSDAAKRNENNTCDLVRTPAAVCNPDSMGVDANQTWDLGLVWSKTGVLDLMGWTGPTKGEGLNSLGQALGRASIVYEFLTKRVVNEICPLGVFSKDDVKRIGAMANPYAAPAGTDDIRTIVAQVAVHPSCM